MHGIVSNPDMLHESYLFSRIWYKVMSKGTSNGKGVAHCCLFWAALSSPFQTCFACAQQSTLTTGCMIRPRHCGVNERVSRRCKACASSTAQTTHTAADPVILPHLIRYNRTEGKAFEQSTWPWHTCPRQSALLQALTLLCHHFARVWSSRNWAMNQSW